MHHEFFVSNVFNEWIADPIARLFGFHGHHVLPPHLVMVILICIGLLTFSALVRRKLSAERPGSLQLALELVFEGILGFMKDIVGPGYRRFFPIAGSLFIFILACNLLGLAPGFMSPTSNINVTLGCALIVFVYYNYHGFKAHGFVKYMAHFAGPTLVLAPLLFLIEIISHFARPLSLSVRLFGNILAEELIIGVLNSIFPFVITLPVMALALFASTIQAFIFVVLTLVYIGGAVEHAHEEEHEEGHSAPAGRPTPAEA